MLLFGKGGSSLTAQINSLCCLAFNLAQVMLAASVCVLIQTEMMGGRGAIYIEIWALKVIKLS